MDLPNRNKTFVSALSQALAREDEIKAWCPQCKQYTPQTTRRTVVQLPSALVVACGVRIEADMLTWYSLHSLFVTNSDIYTGDHLILHGN